MGLDPAQGSGPAVPINLIEGTAENTCHEHLQLRRSSSQGYSSSLHCTELMMPAQHYQHSPRRRGGVRIKEIKAEEGWGEMISDSRTVQGSPVISHGDGAVCQALGAESLQNAMAKCCRKRGGQNCPGS